MRLRSPRVRGRRVAERPASRWRLRMFGGLSPRTRRIVVWSLRSFGAVILVLALYSGITVYPYLSAPGTDTVAARIAEWGRDHHLSWAVTWLENETYSPPPTGGRLNAAELKALAGQGTTPGTAANGPADITPQAADPLPGEGVWHPVTYDAAGHPVIKEAALRPDAQHTSELAYAAWMKQAALRFTLQPGYQQPGGNWPMPNKVSGSMLNGLVATFNGGFKVHPNDALGGYFADGVTSSPLVDGKAAEVFYRDGTLRIGVWGSALTMTSDVVAVRQNLSLLVKDGSVQVDSGAGSGTQWGYTIKNDYYVARSGVGMTGTGDLVYVSGAALSVQTLAHLLRAAGAVDAMELDINPDWISFMTYSGQQSNPSPVKLWNFTQPAGRYLQPSSRDFVSVHLR